MAVNQMQDSPARATRSRHGSIQSEQVPATLCITEKWIRKRLNLQLDSLGQFTGIGKPTSFILVHNFAASILDFDDGFNYGFP